ncbi:MAG: hypothetical protein IPJ49_28760 [Candidatus Obscuribacter sp.]|nr:hypothetical protein [Candidatus Obscuribacter sp.]
MPQSLRRPSEHQEIHSGSGSSRCIKPISAVFVLIESGQKVIRGYYTLSSISVVFDELPKNIQKKLPRYPEASGVLLGRLGVDKEFSLRQSQLLSAKPRLGETLLVDAQARCLAASREQGNALMVVDVEMPNADEIAAGARDPLKFYTIRLCRSNKQPEASDKVYARHRKEISICLSYPTTCRSYLLQL